MEPVVYEDSPLADYLRDGGDGSEPEWAAIANNSSDRASSRPSSPSLPSSPTPFAPSGRPMVKARFRSKAPNIPRLSISSPTSRRSTRRTYSAVVAASIDRADNAKFLEQFRYTIVASQLLTGQVLVGQQHVAPRLPDTTNDSNGQSHSTEGILASILGALALAVILSWVAGSAPSLITRKRFLFLLILLAAGGFLGQIYMKRQWLHYRRSQSLTEVTSFVSNSHDFDSATAAALTLIQEVELVSRGYRISAPLPPISRIEDRSQSRKCIRLRKALKTSFADALQTYNQVADVVKGFAEQTDLEKYLDIYEISEFDMLDAGRGFDADEFDDLESLRTLKIIASRFHTTRKLFLCSLLALDASGENQDLLRWTAAVEALRSLNTSTEESHNILRDILSEEEMFPIPEMPKTPMTPNRERWRSQLHKLNTFGSGIRGLQAKLQLLREESDRSLNHSSDISGLGPNLMSQYESIGVDLKELMSVWEEGKAALALGIDRNEKRLSSMSTLISPTSSLGGLTTVDEGGNAAAALRALTGPSPPASESNEPEEAQEIFEAVAIPRARSTLTREERIIKMREDRENKAQARQQMDATRGMLKELETVINLRPRKRNSMPAGGRIVSM